MLSALAFVPLTAKRAADVDADGPHVGLIRVTDAVVEGDKDAAGGKQQTGDQQAQNQSVQDDRGNSCFYQHRDHYTHTHRIHTHREYTIIIVI